MLNSAVYDKLKWLAMVGLPATGSLYFGLAQLWGLPAGEEVSGSILLVDTFLGVLLGISSKQYNESDEANQGYVRQLGVDPDTGMPHMQVTFKPELLTDGMPDNGVVRLKVGPPPVAEH